MSYDLKAALSAAPDDLTAAARAARYLASTVASIRGLSDSENARKRLTAELADNYEAARTAIRSVTPELKLTRAGAAVLGDIVAPTAHEAAIAMVWALNRETFPFIEIVGREPVRVWPNVLEVRAEIELETARARDRRSQVSAMSTPKAGTDEPAAEQHKEPPRPRLTVDLARRTVTLDGMTYEVSSDRALRWVKVLAEHPGEWISSTELKRYDPELDDPRPDRCKKHLPPEILSLINSDRRKGSRLCLP
jgi:hypothetical protein